MSKVYVVDLGFYAVKGFKFSENDGRLAENLVAVELFRQRAFNSLLEIYYWKDQQQREVDFVVKRGAKVTQLLQVCWNVSDERTREREIKSLAKAGIELDCDDLLVVTADEDGTQTVRQNGTEKNIRFVPLWRWLLTSAPREA